MLQASRPMYVFNVPGLAKLLDPPPEALFDACTVLPRMPPKLNEAVEDRAGWYWLDDKGPVCVGPFVAIGRRQYHKSIPGGMLKESVHRACIDWCARNEVEHPPGKPRVPKDIRSHLTDDVRDELLTKTLPSIRETAVLFDVVEDRVFIFAPSANGREAIWRSIRQLDAIGTAWSGLFTTPPEHEITLTSYLLRLRPGAVLPDGVTATFNRWLFDTAHAEQWLHIKPSDSGDSIRFGLRLDSAVELRSGDTKITTRGDLNLDEVVEHASSSDAPVPTTIERVRVRIETPEERAFILRMDDLGRPAVVRICNPVDVSGTDGGFEALHASILSRATDWSYAHELVLGLYRAFDAIVIGPYLRKVAQTQMFPGGPKASVDLVEFDQDWEPNAVGTPDVGGPYHQWDRQLGRVYGTDKGTGTNDDSPRKAREPVASITITGTNGKSATITAKDLAAAKVASAKLDKAASLAKQKKPARKGKATTTANDESL